MADDAPVDAFRTVSGRGEAAFAVRGSAFVGRVAPVDDVAAAEAFVESVCAANAEATHNVPAYRVRTGDGRGDLLREWSSDDGEPTGSAGKPALTVLVRRDLENIAAVVTRHFGGTELGVGGLARAYGRAVSSAVDDAGVVERAPHRRLTVEVGYDDSGTVRGCWSPREWSSTPPMRGRSGWTSGCQWSRPRGCSTGSGAPRADGRG